MSCRFCRPTDKTGNPDRVSLFQTHRLIETQRRKQLARAARVMRYHARVRFLQWIEQNRAETGLKKNEECDRCNEETMDDCEIERIPTTMDAPVIDESTYVLCDDGFRMFAVACQNKRDQETSSTEIEPKGFSEPIEEYSTQPLSNNDYQLVQLENSMQDSLQLVNSDE